MSGLKEQIFVITGAKGALGSVLTQRLAGVGATVVGWDHHGQGGGALVEDGEMEGVRWQQVDVTDAVALEAALELVEREVGPVAGVIHCAGGFRWSLMDKISTEDIDFLVDLNLRSSLYMARSVMKRFKERGAGRLIFISSRSTKAPGAGEGAYVATKAGLNALVRSLAAEVKESQITVNAIQPSVIDTPNNRVEMPEADFSTWVPREDLADLVEFLVSEKGRSINGAELVVAGRT